MHMAVNMEPLMRYFQINTIPLITLTEIKGTDKSSFTVSLLLPSVAHKPKTAPCKSNVKQANNRKI
jgi:hypothetical protein